MNSSTTGRDEAGLRRPPAPRSQDATVVRLRPPGPLTPSVPMAAVQGTLALDLGRATGLPETPELRLVRASDQDEIQTWAARFAQAVVEVLGGDRPVTQLLRCTTGRVYGDLTRRVQLLGRVTPAVRRRTVRPQVQSVHVFCPATGCAEVSVHVRHGQRSRAIAARLQREEGRWRCTALQLG